MNIDWQTIILTSIPWAVFASLLIYFIKNPEKLEKWGSIIARSLSFLSLRLEKSGVAGDIQSEISDFSKTVGSKTNEPILPYSVKIKWIDSTTRESFVKNGKVIIRMHHHRNQAKNFLYATLEWTNKGLIPHSRNLMDKTVLRAVDLFFISSFLTKTKKHDVKQLFLDEIYEPEVKEGSLLEKYCRAFDSLEQWGGFFGIALPEFSSLVRKTQKTLPEKGVQLETIGFMRMLLNLSKKPHGIDVSPNYGGKYINCSIVLVARQDKYLAKGIEPYLSYINGCIDEGVCSIYVCAIGNANIQVANRIRDAYGESKKIRIVSENVFPVNGNRGIVLGMTTLPNKSTK